MGNEFSIESLINTIFITGVVYGLVFNAILFFMKKRIGKPVLFLNLQVLFITLNNLQAWLIDWEIVSSFIYIKYLRVPWYFLCMPFFYVFLISYLKIKKKTTRFLNISLGIFIGFIVLRILLIYYCQRNELNTDIFMNRYSTIEEIVGFLYTLCILIYSIVIFYKRKNMFEFVLNFDDLKWIKHYMNLAGVILIIWVIAIIMNAQDSSFSSPDIYYPLRLSTTIVIYWIGFKGFFRFRITEDRIVLRENIKKKIIQKNVDFNVDDTIDSLHQSNKLRSDKQQLQFDKINEYVVNNKTYLDPFLSLESLAEELNMSGGYLSHLINTFSKYNFSDYINEFRVEQAKMLIMDEEYNNYTIVAIGLESGFNSKSTFYSSFKKFTAVSPIQFRQ